MDNIQTPEPEQIPDEIEAKKKKNKIASYIFVGILAVIYIILRVKQSDSNLVHINTAEKEQAQQTAEEAILATCNMDSNMSYEEYFSNICEIASTDFCENYRDSFTKEDYENIQFTGMHCEINSSEFISPVNFTDIDKKAFAYRIQYTFYSEDSDTGMDFDEAVFMVNEGGWKLFHTNDYEEFMQEQIITEK